MKPSRRKLKVSTSGHWYLALTIAMGVVAIVTSNNILYLLESFLLGGLILSGILSERAISAVDIEWRRTPTIAGEPCRDRIKIHNRRSLPIFCLEVGEVRGGEFIPHLFVPFLPPRGSVEHISAYAYARRGEVSWEGHACATRYPFGFAKKIRWFASPGTRLVWPERTRETLASATPSAGGGERAVSRRAVGGDFSEGEVRAIQPGDDYRYVIWSLSEMRGEPLVRVRRARAESVELLLDARLPEGAEFERRISAAASCFYADGSRKRTNEFHQGSLILVDAQGKRRYEGGARVLNLLATLRGDKPR
ncbi:MAG: DUF58 domain-containing protein [Bacteriovoracia bacterium]